MKLQKTKIVWAFSRKVCELDMVYIFDYYNHSLYMYRKRSTRQGTNIKKYNLLKCPNHLATLNQVFTGPIVGKH